MAITRIDDVQIAQTGGAYLAEAAIDTVTNLSWSVYYKMATATAQDVTLTVTLGSESVTLIPTVTDGEINAELTAAQKAALGAQRGDTLTVWLRGKIVDGSIEQHFESESLVGVSDRTLRFPVSVQRIKAKLPLMGRSATHPYGQSSHNDQIVVACEDCRSWINKQHGGVKTYLLGQEGTLRELVEAFILLQIVDVMNLQTGGQGEDLPRRVSWLRKDLTRIQSELVTVVRDSSAFGTEGSSREVMAEPNYSMSSIARGPGGML